MTGCRGSHHASQCSGHARCYRHTPTITEPRRQSSPSAFVDPDELRDRKDLAPEDPLQLPHASARRKPQVLAHGMEPEAVAVASVPARRAWPAIADRAEVVAPLQRSR